ncbi:caspase family protein [Rhodopirellula sp. JC639]|uniref:caspase family protein n=1 Tax=Stieleria mannarensis TaxID=2755585 RepID=UPI001604645B|nr:caspase family protein [Rhodopirellula sp. JC639]
MKKTTPGLLVFVTFVLFSGALCFLFIALRAADEAPAGTDQSTTPTAMNPGPKALLIGCNVYPNLGAQATLRGPANDVMLMKQLLTTQFEFDDANIVVLSSTEPDDRQPTKANIQRAFEAIADQCREGEHFVFFFAGHGTQVPDQPTADDRDPEPDGFDEALLPVDAGRWDDQQSELPNAIRDDELGQWIQRVVDHGAIPWVVVDACHSGTVVRAATSESFRKLDPKSLGIPQVEADRQSGSLTSRGLERESVSLEVSEDIPQLAALYAALPSEPTPEMQPLDGGDTKVHGLLTYALYKTLTSASTPLSYNDLVSRIRSQYRAWGRMYPTPIAEGSRLNDSVLGSEHVASQSRLNLLSEAEGLRINAGTLYGFHSGSVFAVYPLPGSENPDQPIGAVRITDGGSDLFQSGVEPFAWSALGLPKLPDDAAHGCPCKPVYIDYGDQKLKVAIAPPVVESSALTTSQQTDDALRKRVAETITALAEQSDAMVEITSSAAAQWVLQVEAGRIEITNARGWVKEFERQAEPPRFGPVPTDDQMQPWLAERFRRLCQASNLIQLAGLTVASDVRVKLSLLKFNDSNDDRGEAVQEHAPIVLREDELVAFEISNLGATPADVTLLFVDSGYGITNLFPRGSVLDNRLSPGKSRRTQRFPVDTTTTGIEYVVAIAVQAGGEPVAFSFLEQSTIEQVGNHQTRRGGESPLGLLLRRAQFRQGETRGLVMDEFEKHQFTSISWTVAESARPTEVP